MPKKIEFIYMVIGALIGSFITWYFFCGNAKEKTPVTSTPTLTASAPALVVSAPALVASAPVSVTSAPLACPAEQVVTDPTLAQCRALYPCVAVKKPVVVKKKVVTSHHKVTTKKVTPVSPPSQSVVQPKKAEPPCEEPVRYTPVPYTKPFAPNRETGVMQKTRPMDDQPKLTCGGALCK